MPEYRCGPPYSIAFDDDYEKLCPWAKVMKAGKLWPDELTDFASDISNRKRTTANREEKTRSTEQKGTVDYMRKSLYL